MSEQKNSAPRPLNDDELEAAIGGAVGINPLLLLANGGQGIYTAGGEAQPAPAPVAPGVNPLYVESTAPVGNVAPVYTPTHDATPAPQAAAPAHDTSVAPVGLGPLTDGSLALAHQAITNALPPTSGTTPVPQATTPTHDTSTIIAAPSTGLGESLNIAPVTSTLHISGTATVSGTPVALPDQNPVSVLTLGTSTTTTTVTPTVNGIRYVDEVGAKGMFDLAGVHAKTALG